MAGVVFFVNVPKREHEFEIKNNKTNLMYEREKFENNFKLINELKEKQNDRNMNGVVKCKSTNSLNSNDLYSQRSKSEISSADGYWEGKNLAKMSWGDLKQMLRKKNKLVINKKVRSVDLLSAFHWDTPLENILSDVLSRLDVTNMTWNSTKDNKFWQVIFSLESGKLSEELLQVLRTFGIGSRHQSSVSVVPCALYYQSNEIVRHPASKIESAKLSYGDSTNSSWSRFTSSVRARRNLAQVLHDVRRRAGLTFDWTFLLVVAAFVAAIGLIEDSTAILVASMLISPLLSPVTAGTLGTAVRDRSLQRMGVRNEFFGLFLALSVGFIVGLLKSMLDDDYGVSGDWPTHEMTSRCEYRSLWTGALVAIPTGAGVTLAILGDYTASLVGVAISAALLPPAVNAGLLWSMAVVRLVYPNDILASAELPEELAILGTTSLCLTLINITCIFVSGVVVYKVKKVCPLDRRDISWWRASKDSVQDSGGDQQSDTTTQPSSLDWDVYNKWCSETLVMKENIAKDSPPLTQSDTVTYRRRPSSSRKQMRAQNIENCLRNAQLSENYLTLHTKTNNEDHTKQIDDIETNAHNEQNHKLNDTENVGFSNLGYKHDEESCKSSDDAGDKDEKYEEEKDSQYETGEEYAISYKSDEDYSNNKHPTIDPSLNITVELKKHRGQNTTIDV